MYFYRTYGLNITSKWELPELMPSPEVTSDVVIQYGALPWVPQRATATGGHFHGTPDEVCFFYEDVGAFQVRGGHTVIIEPVPGIEERVLRLFILGSALGILLLQRGLLVLHASAVAINGQAVAFLGGKGWGKSTMTAALYAYGYRVLADDIVAIKFNPNGPIVLPGFPQLKLTPESSFAIGVDPDTQPQLHPQVDKRGYRVTDQFELEPVPLTHVFVLNQGQQTHIETLPSAQALIELVAHSYGTALLQKTGIAAIHLQQCAQLMKHISLNRLTRPADLTLLPVLVQLLKQQIEQNVVVNS